MYERNAAIHVRNSEKVKNLVSKTSKLSLSVV